ncbi:MAG: hypothetical protein GYB31_12125 [Bacteroidetes bacterium]|nr:hypothetical protein [Bacteroidota bacterium]
MQAGRRYTLPQLLSWTSRYILIFLVLDSIPVILYLFTGFEWLVLPWQPISLIGIAVAFYLGFKNNSSYERLWEARKIWGGIVNTSRSFTVMVVNFINNDEATDKRSEKELTQYKKTVVYRHVAWLHALTFQMRKFKPWEHSGRQDTRFRELMGTNLPEEKFDQLKEYLSEREYQYIMSKGNQASHLLNRQTVELLALRQKGNIEHFRHLEMQNLITELYSLQGKSERIKNFPFPRQYATVNYYFVLLFILLLPFGMLSVFTGMEADYFIWLSIPFSVMGSWVFWTMEMIGDYSENPFEGLFNDVPITAMARGIEIDIRQMLDETDLPQPITAVGDMKIQV